MPAGILPFKRELNAFAGVSPRYLEKVHREEKTYVPPPQERYDTQRQWEGVQSRYLTNVSSVEQQKLREDRIIRENNLLADRQDPLGGWEQRDMHREYTKRHGLGAVTSRYEEDAVTKGHPDVTPRDLVRKKDEIEKLEKGWRGTHSLNKHTTFDVLYKKRLKAHPEDDPNNFKKNKARSPVSDYVRHGTPIESVSRNGVPGSGGSLSFVNNNSSSSGGGARSSSAQIRRSSQSPWQRSSSPETFAYGQWRSGGVTSSSFEALRKQTLKANPHFARGEERAKSVIERQQSTKVDESFVPRVASLALAYQLPGGTARSDSMSQSPYRNNNNNNNNNNNSPNRRSATIRNQSPIAHHHQNNTNGSSSSIRRANSPTSSSANASRNNSPYRRSTNASNLANKNSSSYSYQNNNSNSSNSKKQQHQQQKQKSYKINNDDEEDDDDKKKKETAEEKELAEERQRQLEDEMLSAEMR